MAALETADGAACLDLLSGTHEGLRGRKHVDRPPGWSAAFKRLVAEKNANLVEEALLLGLDFDEPTAVSVLSGMVRDREAPRVVRQRMLAELAERRVPNLLDDLYVLVDDQAFRGQALRALAAYDDPRTPELVVNRYGTFSAAERADAIATLAARPKWALALLAAVELGKVPRRDLSVAIARQLQGFGDRKINERLEAVWGKIQPTSRAKASLVAKYKAMLAPEPGVYADRSRGRGVFGRACLACHKLFDAGGDVGPELTGSDRANPDYILENVLDPSAAVSHDYTVTQVATTDGRLIAGIIRSQTNQSVVVQTANERIVVPRRYRGHQAVDIVDDARGIARSAHAPGSPRPVCIPGIAPASSAVAGGGR